jgi:hypothetical protein
VLRTGPGEPIRLTGATRPEPAHGPIHAVGARVCAADGAWRAPVPSGPSAGHGTAGQESAVGRLSGQESAVGRLSGQESAVGRLSGQESAVGHLSGQESTASTRARIPGWRMVSRALVTGGFLLCGWFLTSAGHAYAATITAPPAPHQLSAGAQAAGSGASVARPVTATLSDTAHGLVSGAAHGLAGLASPASGTGQVGSLLSGLGNAGALGNPGGGLVSTGAGRPGLQVPGAAPVSPPAITSQVTGAGTAPAQVTVPSPTRAAGIQWRLVTGAFHSARHIPHTIRPAASEQRSDGYAPTLSPASHATPSRVRPVRHRGPGTRQTKLPHHAPPGPRLGTGATPQSDPTSAGGGTGTAQLAVPSLSGSGGWIPAGRLIRVRMSRWPVVRQAVDDPAVSPD